MIGDRAQRSRLLLLITSALDRSAVSRWSFSISSILAGLLLCIVFLPDANAQNASSNADEIGVRHSVFAAVELDRDSAFAKAKVGELIATMHIVVRILDYAVDSRFYGVVNGNFNEFDPIQGVAAEEIWADRKCHQNRGLPKIWVLALNGRIRQGATTIDIAGRPRHIGQLLPGDEIVMQKVVTMDFSDHMPRLDMRATTRRSPLSVNLTVKSAMCRLEAH